MLRNTGGHYTLGERPETDYFSQFSDRTNPVTLNCFMKRKKSQQRKSSTKKENIEHPTTSTTDSDSSIAVKVLEIDSCGSADACNKSLLTCLKCYLENLSDLSQKWNLNL